MCSVRDQRAPAASRRHGTGTCTMPHSRSAPPRPLASLFLERCWLSRRPIRTCREDSRDTAPGRATPEPGVATPHLRAARQGRLYLDGYTSPRGPVAHRRCADRAAQEESARLDKGATRPWAMQRRCERRHRSACDCRGHRISGRSSCVPSWPWVNLCALRGLKTKNVSELLVDPREPKRFPSGIEFYRKNSAPREILSENTPGAGV